MTAMPVRYEADYYSWSQEQAAMLRAGRLDQIDLENLAEEIESLGRSDRRSLGSQLQRAMMHLLKWRYQPEMGGNSWRRSIREARKEVAVLLEDSPSLVRMVPGLIGERYRMARLDAIDETGFPAAAFPKECPFAVEQVLVDAGLGETELDG
ncbi:DUF29 domain-containing protein [uncultured Gammaproteobacteria bacterium]